MLKKQLPYIIRNISSLLVLILCVKIAGYFCIVEDRTINQVYKTISRIGMTGLIIVLQFRLIQLGCQSFFKYENVLAPVFYLIYLLLAIASFMWSTDVSYSILQWLMTFESLVFVFVFMRVISMVNTYFPKHKIDLIKIFTLAVFPIMVIFIAGSFIEPDLFYRGMRGGEEQRLGGYYMNPNELGMLSSIGAAMTYLYFQKTKKKFFPIVMMITSIIVLVLTASRSSAIGFLLIMGVLVLQSNNKKLKIAMFVGAGLAVPALLKFVIFKDDGGLEEVLSMTGRIPFWTALLQEGIVREPFFGYGFMRINYTDYFESLNTYAAKMTHNTFMQVLMNLGFVGFFIAFWQLVLTIRNFFKERKQSLYGNFFIALFIPAFINSLTEFGIFGETNFGILFYQFLILLFVIQIRQNRSKKETLLFNLFQKRWKLNPKLL
ncbi:MAG: O-antigen ligase family protein [Flavobacteriales bacterium]|nr:O-antigen ligase family protein [Flavobacteriales bacterium]